MQNPVEVQEKKKKSFFNSIKEFFSSDIDQQVVVNEATSNLDVIEYKQVNSNPNIEMKMSNEGVFKIDNDIDDSNLYEEETQTRKNNSQQILQEYKIMKIFQSQAIGKPIEKGYIKKQMINFPPESTFRIMKPIKSHKSLMDFLASETERNLALDGGWLYILYKQGKDKFQVSSARQLSQLTQILIKTNEVKPTFRLIFTDREIKRFYLIDETKEQLFYLKLRTECLKHGIDFLI